MLELFRKNRIQTYFFVLIYVVLLRLFTFFNEYDGVSQGSIIYDLWGLTFGEDKVWYKIFSILIIFYQAILVNRLTELNNLSYVSSLIPGVFYVLVLSLIPDIHPLSPMLLGNTFIILAIMQLFQTIHRNQRSKRLFNTGFFVSLAVFFDSGFIYYVPFFIVAVNAVILVRIRDVILYLLGVLTPFYFLTAYWVLLDQASVGYLRIWEQLRLFNYEFIYQNYGIIKTGIVGLLAIFIFAVLNTVITRTNIFVRNKLTFLFYLMVMSVAAFGLGFDTSLDDLQLIILPAGILMGLYIVGIRRISIAESIHLLLLILVVLFQYFLI